MNLLTSLPAWAVTPEAQAWVLGLGAAGMVRVFRAGLRWFKRVSSDRGNYGD
jgi:hypothetical protein